LGQAQSFTFVQFIISPLTAITLDGATTSRLFACNPTVYDSRRATDTGIDFYRFRRTVQGAGPALHTEVFVGDPRFAVCHVKHTMRTDFGTASATDAQIGGIGKRRYILQVSMFHLPFLFPKR
jgi:hypothetical protein